MLDEQEPLLYYPYMRSCMAIIVFTFVFGALLLSLLYNITFLSSLSFEKKETLPDYINTRRSYRPPMEQKKATSTPLDKLPTKAF